MESISTITSRIATILFFSVVQMISRTLCGFKRLFGLNVCLGKATGPLLSHLSRMTHVTVASGTHHLRRRLIARVALTVKQIP